MRTRAVASFTVLAWTAIASGCEAKAWSSMASPPPTPEAVPPVEALASEEPRPEEPAAHPGRGSKRASRVARGRLRADLVPREASTRWDGHAHLIARNPMPCPPPSSRGRDGSCRLPCGIPGMFGLNGRLVDACGRPIDIDIYAREETFAR